MKQDKYIKIFSLSAIWIWLTIFVFLAFCLTALASLLSSSETKLITLPFTLNNYLQTFSPTYFKIFLKSILLAGFSTFLCLLLGYPFAFIMSRLPQSSRELLLLFLIIPFWTSSLIRSYAMIAIVKTKGLINTALLALGIIHQPLQLLFTNTAVMLGLVYNLLPFMILPLYANLERFDMRLIEAAYDLGATRFTVFRRIILPLSMPGIIAGTILVLLPAMTLFYIPDLLGGAKSLLLGNLIEYQFLTAHNWPQGSAISVVLTLMMGLLMYAYWLSSRGTGGGKELV